MKKRVLQGLAVTGTLVIVVAGIYFLDKFVFGAIEAEKKIAAYEEYYYGIASDADMHFNWKMGSGYVGGGYTYNPDHDLILDSSRNNQYRDKFEWDMRFIDTFDINFEFADYGVIRYYDGSDVSVYYDDLYIYEFYNTQYVEENERIERGATLIWETLSWDYIDHYNFAGVHVDYYDPSGVIHYSIKLDKSRKKSSEITREMLIDAATEISFENNMLIQEKWEKYYSQRDIFWCFEVDRYQISLEGMELCGDYQLIMKNAETAKVIETVGVRSDFEGNYQYDYGLFEDIMGFSGFYIDQMTEVGAVRRYYIINEGEAKEIASTWWKIDWNGFDDNCFVVDVNGDGVTEFITDVVYADGGIDTFIYYNDGSQILSGRGSSLIGDIYDNNKHMSLGCRYVPNENVVEISYVNTETDEFESGKYELDFEKIEWRIEISLR